ARPAGCVTSHKPKRQRGMPRTTALTLRVSGNALTLWVLADASGWCATHGRQREKTLQQEPQHASDAVDGHGGHLGTGSRSRCREASLRAAAARRRPKTSGRLGETD